ncbi:hypothetical protein [Lysobacter gummosus]|uniref:hypothetical protein n=1 Tax=Lysobacter gummosus TaxID=262324 RepID=UPI0036330066
MSLQRYQRTLTSLETTAAVPIFDPTTRFSSTQPNTRALPRFPPRGAAAQPRLPR